MLYFVPAKDTNTARINDLIKRSKSHWDYHPDYLEAAIKLIKVDQDYLNKYPCFEIHNDKDELVCFCSMKGDVLENLWVDPRHIKQGAGTFALGKIKSFAQGQGIKTMWVLPDPPAEEFYLKKGFQDSGESVPSRIANGPIFKKFYLHLHLHL